MTRFLPLLASLCVGQDALAAPPPPPSPQRVAFQRFEEGELAFQDGNFARAAALFGEAFTLHPEPAYLFNRALAFSRLGRSVAASAVFARFLEVFPGSPRRAEVERERAQAVDQAQSRGARIEVRSAPSASAAIDDGEVPELAALACQTPCELAADPGEVTVRVSDGVMTRREKLRLEPGASGQVTLELTPPPAGPPAATWASWSVGAAGLVTGVVFGVLALDSYGEGEDLVASGASGPEAERRLAKIRQRVDDQALAADVGLGVAVVGGLVGGILWWASPAKAPPGEALTWRF